ncbi:MAG: tRNA uridine-5-carboxymethylaminomethyl(34) synthesis GTPase MnmE [Schleiferiaceae bacterium]|nr:tRNA uridine-5-carboxymethylaminomethyl(34) synthesis GTPase MnmE [Schleiferiaceae bacterium]
MKTIVALSTPSGSGAIGIIRISGDDCLSIASTHFPKMNSFSPRKAIFSKFYESSGHVLDEVILVYFPGPNSYTGEDVVEISFHGSSYILQSALKELIQSGAILAKAGEFTQRAFLNGKLDLVQAEAVGDLIASESRSAHDLAMRQMKGSVSVRLQELRQQLIDFAALIELELDFADEDVEFAQRPALYKLFNDLKAEIEKMLDTFMLGNAIKNGIPLILAGAPNAGKSTLLNRFLGEDRAIVTKFAGTTRDSIEEKFRLGDHLFRIVDTAGLRISNDEVEILGIERSWKLMSEGQIILFLIDPTSCSSGEAKELEEEIVNRSPNASILKILTKSDLWDKINYLEYFPDALYTGINVDLKNIQTKLSSFIDDNKWDGSSDILIANVRHADALNSSLTSLNKAEKALNNGVSGEFIAFELKEALNSLGSITGEVIADDLLSSVFGRFCIGK